MRLIRKPHYRFLLSLLVGAMILEINHIKTGVDSGSESSMGLFLISGLCFILLSGLVLAANLFYYYSSRKSSKYEDDSLIDND